MDLYNAYSQVPFLFPISFQIDCTVIVALVVAGAVLVLVLLLTSAAVTGGVEDRQKGETGAETGDGKACGGNPSVLDPAQIVKQCQRLFVGA